jgi:hypothetical protein
MRLVMLAAAALVAGCVSIDQEKLADGRLRLRTEHSFETPQSSALSSLHIAAGEACPAGYRKEADRATGGYMSGYTEWVVRCL